MRRAAYIFVIGAMLAGTLITALPATGVTVTPSTQPVCSATVAPPCVFQGFEIDGNTTVDTTGALDWQSPPPNLTHFSDGTGSSDDIFSTGSKELDQSTWSCTFGSAPMKSDIFPGGDISFRTYPVGGSPHQVVDVDFSRVGTGGDAHIDYEFNKAATVLNTAGCPASAGIPLRSVGDILLAFDSNTGGSTVTISAYKWDGSTFVQLPTGSQGTTFAGTENIPPSFSDPGVAAGQYGEAGLDLTATIGKFNCGEFGKAYMKTRSSTSISSEVKDRTQVLPFNPGSCPSSSLTKAVRDVSAGGTFATSASASPGDTVEYQLTYTNSGQAPATNVVVTDPVPAHSTFLSCSSGCTTTGTSPGSTISWSLGTVSPGTTTVLTFQTKLDATFPSGQTTITNVAKVTTTEEGSKTSNSTTVTVNAASHLTIAKKADNPSVNSGSPIGFTITVGNTGNAVATGATLSDPLPTGTDVNWSINPGYSGPGTCSISGTAPAQQTLTCSFGDIAPGATISVHVTSPTTARTSGTFSNTAVVQATNNPPVSGTDTTTVNKPNLVVTKSPDNPSVNSGSTIGFTITVNNTGAGTATSVTLTDRLPLGTGLNWSIPPGSYAGPGTCSISGTAPAQQTLNCSFGDIAAGAPTISVHVTSPTTAQTSGTFVNVAVAQGTNTPPSSGTGSTTVNQPSLSVTKTADNATVSSGSTIGFKVQVGNAGPGTATGATLSDTLPGATGVSWSIDQQPAQGNCMISTGTPQILSCSFGDIAPGTVLTVHVTSATTAATSGTLSNIATVQATNSPPTSSTASVTVNQPNLGVTKTPDKTPVNTGDTIGFVITVSNAGPGTATSVTLNDPLPAGTGLNWSIASGPTQGTCAISPAPQVLTCSFGDLPPATSVSVHITSPTTGGTVPAGTGTAFKNIATAQGTNTPPASGSGTVVVNAPSVSVTKVADSGTVQGGSQIGFLISVTNAGPGTATNVVVKDNLPGNGGLNWSVNPAVGGCGVTGSVGSQVLTCTFATMAPNTTISIHVVSGTSSATCGTVTNPGVTVTVGNGTTATAPAVSITVACQPKLGLNKAASIAQAGAGATITYTLSYSNTGNGDARNVTISDPIPSGTTFTSCSNGCTTTGSPPSQATWSIGTVPAGGSGSVTLTVTVNVTVGCQICNTATIASPDQAGGSVSSNQVCLTGIPSPNPAGANASGSAFGAKVNTVLLNNQTLVPVRSSQSGVGSNSQNDQVLSVVLPSDGSVLKADVLRTESTSQVTASPAEAKDTSVAEAANVNVLNGLVTADLVRAVASTDATGSSSSFSAAGSTITNLKVQGVAVANVTPNLRIDLPAAVFGSGSYVVIFGQSSPSSAISGSTSGPAAGQTSGGTYAADLTVNMIQVHVTGLANLLSADVTVSNAVAHSDFPQTTVCGTSPLKTVSGHAFVASETTNPSLVPILYGFASIPASGGHGHQDLAGVTTAPLTAGASTSDSQGSLATSSTSAVSYANVANVCVILSPTGGCAVSATAVTAQSSSTAKSTGASSNDSGTQFVNLFVLGVPVNANVAPNTVITLPGIGFVILNEQFCDNGGSATHTCTGTNHSGLTVRAIHVVVNNLANGGILPVGADVIVAEAHSDATFGP